MESYKNTYEVLIASPSDLSDERGKIVKAICEWNFSSKRIAFSPLLWEWNAVSTADQSPQEAINEQLLSRADFVIAAFKGRLGTPTEDGFQAGTIEELAKRKWAAALFFPKKWPSFDSNDPHYDDLNDQLKALREFKKTVTGFPLEYEGADDLINKVKETLTKWAQRGGEEALPVLSLLSGPYDPKKLLRQTVPKGQKAYALMYNTELITLKTKESFENFWSFLRDIPWLEKVIFLLPLFKVKRLTAYLAASTLNADPELLRRFAVCSERGASTQEPRRISTSLAFALLRYGNEPTQGVFAPLTHFAVLAYPFASQQEPESGGQDVKWDYNYYFEFNEPQFQKKLGEIWDQGFQGDSLTDVLKLAEGIPKKTQIDEDLENQKDYKTAVRIDQNVNLIRDLKHKLFDPNVPSYLLNAKFELLDWNNAFELVFPTTHFYRHESVLEFVECLTNKDEIKRRGAELIAGPPRFDLETILYHSPRYGAMRFTKIASMVKKDPRSEESNGWLGWIVALNVNQAEQLAEYERDLGRMNEQQALISEYALCHEQILAEFPGYLELARAHSRALSPCKNILDLGCGPGILSQELLKNGKRVTAIDQNDTMLDAARERCQNSPGFTVVKANLESLHRPDARYAFKKVGIRENYYDGAALFNNYYWLNDPPGFLRRLANEGLLTAHATLTVSLLSSKQDVIDLLAAIQLFQEIQEEEQGDESKIWSESDFDSFSSSLYKIVDSVGNANGEEDMARHLIGAGYEIVARERPVYTLQGRSFSPFAFFVAKLKPNA